MRYVHGPIVAVGTSNSIDNYGGLVVEKRKSGDSNVVISMNTIMSLYFQFDPI